MHDYLLSVFYGIVEGLTEFLPVSSTAHLRIAEAATHISLQDEYWKMYSIVIQLGAILSVIVYFRQRIRQFLTTFPQGPDGTRNLFNHPVTLVLLAFVVTAGPAYVMKKKIELNLESLTIMGLSLLIGGIVMWAVDAYFTRPGTLRMDRMNIFQAFWVGLLQITSAIFPGTSRSMSTIAGGQMAGLSRAAALEFSFFLCIPTMIAATGKELWDSIKHKPAAGTPALHAASGLQNFTLHQWGVLFVGTFVSFLVAWGVIAWFMAWVRKHGLAPFAVYRIILGCAVLVWAVRH